MKLTKSQLKEIIREEMFGMSESKQRSIPDMSAPIIKKLGLTDKDFSAHIKKGFPPDKKFALILIKNNGKVDIFSANRDMKTAQANYDMWSSKYAYPDEVKSWEIIPMIIK